MHKISLIISIFCVFIVFSCTREHTDTFEHFYLRNGNADLYVEINGNIESDVFVILLHGGPGGGAGDYNGGYFTDEMEEDYAMVYIDQRGNGASQGTNSYDDLTIDNNSEDIYLLSQVLKEKYGEDISMFLAGHSWGGLTSAHTLIYTDIQDVLKGWIDMNGAHDFVIHDTEVVKMLQEIGTQEIASDNNLLFWEPLLERVNDMDTLDISDEDSAYLNNQGFQAEQMFDLADDDSEATPSFGLDAPDFSFATLSADSAVNPILNEESERFGLTDELFQITIPSLFLWGKYDFVVPPAIGEIAYENVGSTEKELIIYDRSGHSPMDNEAIQFTVNVKEFVETYK